MKKKIIYTIFILCCLLLAVCLPSSSAEENKEKDNKDSDKDGIPDYLDYEDVPKNSTESESSETKSQMRTSGFFSCGNWSFNYGSSSTYGAWIGEVYWNNSKYIHIANVPWVKIDGVKYILPDDFNLQEVNCTNLSSYYLAYQIYTMNIGEENHTLEILWKFYKSSINQAGKIEIRALHSVNHNNPYSLFASFRIDFDILGANNDCQYVYSSSSWSPQNKETYQFTYAPTDPTWGMKVKQQDFTDSNSWGGIKAWSTNENNYLLKYQPNEYKGDPINYINAENTYKKDDVLWTTASTSGKSPLACAPTLFVH